MRVFLVDEANSVRARIRAYVEEIGAEVVGEACSEREAIEGIKVLLPDVVVLDLRLEEGTGMAVLRYIKKYGRGLETIVLTNYRQDDYQKPCIQAGADYFLEKIRQYTDFEMLLRQMNENCIDQSKP